MFSVDKLGAGEVYLMWITNQSEYTDISMNS